MASESFEASSCLKHMESTATSPTQRHSMHYLTVLLFLKRKALCCVLFCQIGGRCTSFAIGELQCSIGTCMSLTDGRLDHRSLNDYL